MMYHMITDKKRRTAHVAGAEGKPLCRPKTKIEFTITVVGPGIPTCKTCADMELREMYRCRSDRPSDVY